MEVTKEELIFGIRNNINNIREAIQKLTLKNGNPDYHKLRGQLSVQYAKLKYHEDPEFKLIKIDKNTKWYEANKKTNEEKIYNHKPIYIS